MSAIEALCSALIGLCVSWTATLFVLGYSPADSAANHGADMFSGAA